MCVFHQQSYINLLKLLITSISVKGNINKDTTDILIVTSPIFQPIIQKELENVDLPILYYILDLHSLFDAGCARLNIFKYAGINKYERILYLDTDILVNSDINVLFDIELSSEKIYALEEGNIGHDFWGAQFFDFTKHKSDVSAFTSGILLFKNSESMKSLFDSIQTHISDYIHVKKNPVPRCLDQPFIVYNAISQNKYDNKMLTSYVENNPSAVSDKKIVYHFPGEPGFYKSKLSKMTSFWGMMHKIVAVTPSNVYDTEKMKFLLESADILDFKVEVIGIGQEFSWINRMTWFKEFLEKIPAASNPIICFTDAYDVFYVDSLNKIKDKFLSFGADIVWSVEKWYSHQLKIDKQFYDNLGANSVGYKYLNGGTFIGYKKALLKLFREVLDGSLKDDTFINEMNQGIKKYDNVISGLDQSWIAHHLVKNWGKYNIKLDYECDIFYVPCGDWNNIDKYIDSNLKHADTGKKPSIIHVPWKSSKEHILTDLFERFKQMYFTNSIAGKGYSWQKHSIVFLNRGQMDAFGKGTYTQRGNFTFTANFGGRVHNLEFNDDYTEFVSTRKGDGEIIKGKLL